MATEEKQVHAKRHVTPENRRPVDRSLDRLYARNIRCPYCRAVIPKFTSTCVQCGITKEQIANGSNKEAKRLMWGKDKGKGKVLRIKRRPDDVPVVKFLLLLVFFGMFGAHNFVVGRRVRGWIMLISTTLLIASTFIFPHASAGDLADTAHPWRAMFERNEWFPFFPLDIPGFIAVTVWFVDWIAIVIFNQYRYPVYIAATDELEEQKSSDPFKLDIKKDEGEEQSVRAEEESITVDEALAQRKKKPPPQQRRKQQGKRGK